MQKNKNTQSGLSQLMTLLIILIAVLALGIGLYVSQSNIRTPQQLNQQMANATFLPQSRPLPQFSLTNNKGKSFSNVNLKGHWTFFFFGFTHCPHICPTTMAELGQVFQLLKAKKITEPQFVLVSIDPTRDTVQRLNTYVTAFNPAFIGTTGTETQIKKLTRAMSVVYMKVKPKTSAQAANYDIDHSGSVMLINPKGELTAFFAMPHEAKKMVADYLRIKKYAAV